MNNYSDDGCFDSYGNPLVCSYNSPILSPVLGESDILVPRSKQIFVQLTNGAVVSLETWLEEKSGRIMLYEGIETNSNDGAIKQEPDSGGDTPTFIDRK